MAEGEYMIFAGVVHSEDVPCTAEREDWLNAPVEIVWFKDLILTQDCVVIAQLFQTGKRLETDDDYIHVGVWNGSKYLYNGHHRATKAALRGEVGMLARIHNF